MPFTTPPTAFGRCRSCRNTPWGHLTIQKICFQACQTSRWRMCQTKLKRIIALQLLIYGRPELENHSNSPYLLMSGNCASTAYAVTPDSRVDAMRVIGETRSSEPRYHDGAARSVLTYFSGTRIGRRDRLRSRMKVDPYIAVPWRTHLNQALPQRRTPSIWIRRAR